MRRSLQLGALLALVVATILLSTPVTRSEGTWAVTVGTASSEFVPVGADTTPLIRAAFSDRELLGSSDRMRLVAAFGLAGLAGGIGLALTLGRPSTVNTE